MRWYTQPPNTLTLLYPHHIIWGDLHHHPIPSPYYIGWPTLPPHTLTILYRVTYPTTPHPKHVHVSIHCGLQQCVDIGWGDSLLEAVGRNPVGTLHKHTHAVDLEVEHPTYTNTFTGYIYQDLTKIHIVWRKTFNRDGATFALKLSPRWDHYTVAHPWNRESQTPQWLLLICVTSGYTHHPDLW